MKKAIKGEKLIKVEVTSNFDNRHAKEMGQRWIEAATEAATLRTYTISEVNGKFVPAGYTMGVMNEGTAESVKIFLNGTLVASAKTRGAAKRKMMQTVTIPAGYFLVNTGVEIFFKHIVNSRAVWLKDASGEFVKGYNEADAKKNLLVYLKSC